jgi:hypothetical protein
MDRSRSKTVRRMDKTLLVSKVPRALEAKTRLFGFELGDLLLIFLYLAVTNLVFGSTRLKFPIVWLGTLAIAGVLYFVKRNKPDQFLQHWGEFKRMPGILSAGRPDLNYCPYFSKKGEAASEGTKN